MIYKKYTSFLKQNISLLQKFYHVKSNNELLKCIFEDFLLTLFLRSGSGLITGLLNGVISKMFIKSKWPVVLGRRAKIMHPSQITLGHHVWIRDDVSIVANGKIVIGNDFVLGERSEMWSYGKGIYIGDNVGIGKNCYIAQLGGRLTIGNNVLISDSVRIYTLTHKYNNPRVLILRQGYDKSEIHIQENVWIGSGSIIINNVTIGEGSVIGANTVVTKNVPDHVVFAGVPGKVIKKIL